MKWVEGKDTRQYEMRIGSIEDEIGTENAARFIEVFVDSLEIKSMGFNRVKPAVTGRPPFDPRDMLKLYIYGHINGIRSSRKLERECGRNIELFFLLNRLKPDHNTISNFRRDNAKPLKAVFTVFVHACVDMNLTGNQVCIDGTPIRAVNGKKRATSPELSKKKLEYAKAQLEAVERYLQTLDEEDLRENKLDKAMALDLDKDHLPNMDELKRRIALHEENLQIMKNTKKTSLLFTDPEAAMMRTKDGSTKACYNVQTAVDTVNHLIVGYDVTNNGSDRGQLCKAANIAKQEMGLETVQVIADKGYESGPDIEQCLLNGIVPDVGFIYDRDERVFSLDYSGEEITEEKRASQKTEDIQDCLHAGVLPKCYENTNISIQVQEETAISCFIRHADGRVTCPMGRELFKMTEKKYGIVYGSHEACRTCTNRCTDSKNNKTVNIGHNSTYVPVRMFGDPRYPLQQIPNIQQDSPYNSFERSDRSKKRVMIFIKRDIPKQKLRIQVSEHPFGTVKWYDGAHYFLCKGKEKTTAETALMFLGYNIRRCINIFGGTQALIRKFKEKYQGITMQKCRI